jgi:hypothetical protein
VNDADAVCAALAVRLKHALQRARPFQVADLVASAGRNTFLATGSATPSFPSEAALRSGSASEITWIHPTGGSNLPQIFYPLDGTSLPPENPLKNLDFRLARTTCFDWSGPT